MALDYSPPPEPNGERGFKGMIIGVVVGVVLRNRPCGAHLVGGYSEIGGDSRSGWANPCGGISSRRGMDWSADRTSRLNQEPAGSDDVGFGRVCIMHPWLRSGDG